MTSINALHREASSCRREAALLCQWLTAVGTSNLRLQRPSPCSLPRAGSLALRRSDVRNPALGFLGCGAGGQAGRCPGPGQGRPPKPGKTRTKQRGERLAQAKEAAARGPALLASGNLKKGSKPGPCQSLAGASPGQLPWQLACPAAAVADGHKRPSRCRPGPVLS